MCWSSLLKLKLSLYPSTLNAPGTVGIHPRNIYQHIAALPLPLPPSKEPMPFATVGNTSLLPTLDVCPDSISLWQCGFALSQKARGIMRMAKVWMSMSNVIRFAVPHEMGLCGWKIT